MPADIDTVLKKLNAMGLDFARHGGKLDLVNHEIGEVKEQLKLLNGTTQKNISEIDALKAVNDKAAGRSGVIEKVAWLGSGGLMAVVGALVTKLAGI